MIVSSRTVLCPRVLLILAVLMPLTGIGNVAAQRSVNSTSQNTAAPPAKPVRAKPFISRRNFQVVAANDLGMHCGDLDHRVASILPPFNVLHAQVIKKGGGPIILTETEAALVYSAGVNPKDPALRRTPVSPIFKTNFWDINPRTNNTLAFDAYDAFYPPGVLAGFPVTFDMGLPTPDVERLYLGDGGLVLDQQEMPSVTRLNPVTSRPYVANARRSFGRFDHSFPFFVNFPFGYTLAGLDWFAADGIPITPFDDLGRKNPYPLMRVQAKDRTGSLTGIRGRILASVDTVTPVSAEADCWRCHTSSIDGGNGEAACLPELDLNCPRAGSPTNRSAVAFPVATAGQDTAAVPPAVSREWAADWNIVLLHDAKHGTALAAATPVVCQRCHYTPALDLAQLGPLGPRDPGANGREQVNHQSSSRVIHSFHGKLDLFRANLPPPTHPRRLDPVTGKPVINRFVRRVLNKTCYQCHPGRDTKCLRGAMFNAGLVCQDCHGGMLNVGRDFSGRFPRVPFPAGADLTKRVPWASEPGCQSCHTGDALRNLAQTDPNVIPAKDGIRLLRAYRTNDPSATPIQSPTSRFAENQVNGARVLYRLSKENHVFIFCEACHGSTHAEWPVQPSSGAIIANDNMTSIQLQGHPGKVIECTACHLPGSLPVSLGGPHNMHPVNNQNWVNGHGGFIAPNNALPECQACHGITGQGTVLSRIAVNRTFTVRTSTVDLARDTLLGCGVCHRNPL